MLNFSGPYRFSAMFFVISAILHIIAPVVGLFSQASLMLPIVGVVYILISMGLNREWRWLAYLAFLVSLFGAVAAYASALGAVAGMAILFWLILVADLVAMSALFIKLWQAKPVREHAA